MARGSRGGGKAKRNTKPGVSFKKFVNSLEQQVTAAGAVEQETYDDEGDAYEQSVVGTATHSGVANRMTSKERREMRTRALLLELNN